MKANGKAIRINLATRPARSRRIFLLARVGLVLVMILSGAVLVLGLLKHAVPAANLRPVLSGDRQVLNGLDAEFRKIQAAVREKENALGPDVEAINAVIYRKSFSWLSLLSGLEKALPDSCYLTYLSPAVLNGGSVSLKIRVVSGGLDDLMNFIDRLSAAGFNGIRTTSESGAERQGMETEMSLTYEGHE